MPEDKEEEVHEEGCEDDQLEAPLQPRVRTVGPKQQKSFRRKK